MSAVYARCIRRFLYTLSRVEISVYAVYPDTCGRSYPYIFVYADVTVSEPVFNAHALLTSPLRCPDTNRIRVDGRIRFVYATCGRRYFCIRIKKICGYKISGYVWTGPENDILFRFFMSSPPPPTPALPRFPQLGLNRKKMVAVPLRVLR